VVLAVKPTLGEGRVTLKLARLETPPPGLGFTTVTATVCVEARSVAKIVACNCEALMNVVARALPFQFTTDALRKPVPFTVN